MRDVQPNLAPFVSGVIAGGMATLVLHPLDLIKIRFQVHDGQQSRDLLPSSKSAAKTGHFGTFTLDYVKQLLRASSRSKGYSSQSLLSRLNIIRSTLYQGVVPNFIGATLSWGLYFSFYTAIKDLWPKNVRSTDAVDTLAPAPMKLAEYFAASCIAGLMTLSLTNPIWVVKTRMCLESNPLISDSTPYRSILGSLKEIYQSQGLKGFYCGFLPGILGITHGGIQFALYEQLKVLAHSLRPATGLMSARNEPLNTLNSTEIMLISSVSKLAASLVTYPYQVLRSRLQDVRGDTRHIPYSGFFDVVHRTFRFEGWKGFYRGLFPNLLRMLPGSAITFVVYENSMNFLTRHKV